MLDLVEVVLRADGLEFARLDGSVPQQVRDASCIVTWFFPVVVSRSIAKQNMFLYIYIYICHFVVLRCRTGQPPSAQSCSFCKLLFCFQNHCPDALYAMTRAYVSIFTRLRTLTLESEWPG